MKVRASVKKMCDACRVVKRRGKVFIVCKENPKARGVGQRACATGGWSGVRAESMGWCPARQHCRVGWAAWSGGLPVPACGDPSSVSFHANAAQAAARIPHGGCSRGERDHPCPGLHGGLRLHWREGLAAEPAAVMPQRRSLPCQAPLAVLVYHTALVSTDHGTRPGRAACRLERHGPGCEPGSA